MQKLLKIFKWIIIVFFSLILLLIGLIYFNTSNDANSHFGIKSEARNILFGIGGDIKKAEKELKKVTKMENSWREFDFSDIQGETPYMVFGTEPSPSMGKYNIEDIKIYKNIGFIVGDDRREVQDNIVTTEGSILKKTDELMQAYVFRTKDNGKTFDKQCLGHGTANYVGKIANSIYIAVTQLDTKTGDVFKSDNMGNTWKKVSFIPWAIFNSSTMLGGDKGDEITYDAGKTWEKTSEKLQSYIKKYLKYPAPESYKNKLVTLEGRKLIFFNLETDQEEIVPLNVPKGKIIDDGTLHSDKETGELSLRLYHDVVGNPRTTQSSIWFPLEDKEVVFDKKLPEAVNLEVHGKYIGGFTKVEGVVTHIWTLDKGEHWDYELLPNYFWDKTKGYGNGQIWIWTSVRGKKGLENGSYLAIGTFKDYE